jgi:hypothetical protein
MVLNFLTKHVLLHVLEKKYFHSVEIILEMNRIVLHL